MSKIKEKVSVEKPREFIIKKIHEFVFDSDVMPEAAALSMLNDSIINDAILHMNSDFDDKCNNLIVNNISVSINSNYNEQDDDKFSKISTTEIAASDISNEKLAYYNALCYLITNIMVSDSVDDVELVEALFLLMNVSTNIREKLYNFKGDDDDHHMLLIKGRDCKVLLYRLFEYIIGTVPSKNNIFYSGSKFCNYALPVKDVSHLIVKYLAKTIYVLQYDRTHIEEVLRYFAFGNHDSDMVIFVDSNIL